MQISVESAPVLAAALIEMRGDTLASISKATDIRVANLSVWLRGREQVISQARVIKILEHLGVVGGELDANKVHEWDICGGLDSLRRVIDMLITDELKATSLVLSKASYGYPQIHFLGLSNGDGWAWVKVRLSAGLAATQNLNAEALGFGQQVVSVDELVGIAIDDVELTNKILLNRIETSRQHTQSELKSGINQLIQRVAEKTLSGVATVNVSSDFKTLQSELERTIRNGVSPLEIAALIANTYPLNSNY